MVKASQTLKTGHRRKIEPEINAKEEKRGYGRGIAVGGREREHLANRMEPIRGSRGFFFSRRTSSRPTSFWLRRATDSSVKMPEDVAEKPIAFQSDTSRRRILLSYWVVVLLGIPLWWVTTSLTRLPLPESSVRALESKQVSFLCSFGSKSVEYSIAHIRAGCIYRRRFWSFKKNRRASSWTTSRLATR